MKNNLRSGYTTGACAAAAAKAAVLAWLNQESVRDVRITLPGGSQVLFKINKCEFDRAAGSCSVIKDAGDDPDITNGAEIWAAVSGDDKPGIHIDGGTGVGRVTKPGLEIPVNEAAINPVPRKMIAAEVNAAVEDRLKRQGVKVVISVTKGVELAKKTLNPRLGIVGGISILGTTGIVIPYSVNAYTACISQALDVAAACGCQEAVLTTGRRSEKFAQCELKLKEECFIQAGDYIGFALKECRQKHLPRAIIWGMIGKISKLAAGHLYTNISDSAVDLNILVEAAKDAGVPVGTAESMKGAVSANHFRELVPSEYLARFASMLCKLAARQCSDSVRGEVEIECIMSDYEGAVLGRANAQE
jgi:cobalt-precorrin-5B (C1)-methyltransferase